jgi:hypothetical protein
MRTRLHKIFNNAFAHAISWGILYSILGLYWAHHSNDVQFSFQLAHTYRTVFNNLHFPEITAWLAMCHPANGTESHLYSTMLGPGYLWCLTLWCQWFGLTTLNIRYFSVLIYFFPLILGLVALLKAWKCDTKWLPGLYLLSPLLLIHSIVAGFVVMSFGFYFLVIAEMITSSGSRALKTKIGIYAFLTVFFQFLNAIHLAMFFILYWLYNKKWKNKDFYQMTIFTGAGAFLAILISLFWRNFVGSNVLSFLDYIKTRGDQAIMEPQQSGYLLFALERVWGQFSYNYPLVFVFIFSLGGVFFLKCKEKAYLIPLIITHFLYCLFLAGTTAAHYYYSFFYLLLTPCLLGILLKHYFKDFDFLNKAILIMGMFLLMLLSAYGLKKYPIWTPQDKTIDQFLSNLKQEDLLIRDLDYNPWPFQMNNPINTVFLNEHDLRLDEALKDISKKKVYGYETTWNTAYHVRPKYKNWRAFNAEHGKAYYFTTKELKYKKIHEVKVRPIHEAETIYRIYQIF